MPNIKEIIETYINQKNEEGGRHGSQNAFFAQLLVKMLDFEKSGLLNINISDQRQIESLNNLVHNWNAELRRAPQTEGYEHENAKNALINAQNNTLTSLGKEYVDKFRTGLVHLLGPKMAAPESSVQLNNMNDIFIEKLKQLGELSRLTPKDFPAGKWYGVKDTNDEYGMGKTTQKLAIVNAKYSFSLHDGALQVFQKNPGKLLKNPTEIAQALDEAYKSMKTSVFLHISSELKKAESKAEIQAVVPASTVVSNKPEMASKNVSYSIHKDTLDLAENYLKELKAAPQKMGIHLRQCLERNNKNINDINDPRELLSFLMKSRVPRIFAETEIKGNGADWSEVELRLLSQVSVNFHNLQAFNDGKWGKPNAWSDYSAPTPVAISCVSGALMTGANYDQKQLLQADNHINEEEFYKHYERKLLPTLLAQNEFAKKLGKEMVVNVPGIGCGCFAGAYESEVRKLLPRLLDRLIKEHGDELTQLKAVVYDPYLRKGLNEQDLDNTIQASFGKQIQFHIRPSEGNPSAKAQLVLPTGYEDKKYHLVKINAWDPASFIMNDMWGDKRTTDEATVASTDALKQAWDAGLLQPSEQFKNKYDVAFRYDSKIGAQMPCIKVKGAPEVEYQQIQHSKFVAMAALQMHCKPEDFIVYTPKQILAAKLNTVTNVPQTMPTLKTVAPESSVTLKKMSDIFITKLKELDELAKLTPQQFTEGRWYGVNNTNDEYGMGKTTKKLAIVNDKYSFSLKNETLEVYQKKTGKVLQDPAEILQALEEADKSMKSSIFPVISGKLAAAVEHATHATTKNNPVVVFKKSLDEMKVSSYSNNNCNESNFEWSFSPGT